MNKVLLYKGGTYYNYAICVDVDSPIYSEALEIGFQPVSANEVRQLDCPVKWTL